ncbi:hypothetical protein [Henriciella marina]|uniref:DUF2970 domain-containing protein n=1 Tax=Henriciella marina TaxID=453851 RepID=A0ABT4LRZ7_9PROT|nr:hypothetical protein [Henriciella marina]MCZ4297142.1 hypothetical protein [Henriciella marina]
MEKHDSFRSWWAGVPSREKPGLKMLGIVFFVVMAVSALVSMIAQLLLAG